MGAKSSRLILRRCGPIPCLSPSRRELSAAMTSSHNIAGGGGGVQRCLPSAGGHRRAHPAPLSPQPRRVSGTCPAGPSSASKPGALSLLPWPRLPRHVSSGPSAPDAAPSHAPTRPTARPALWHGLAGPPVSAPPSPRGLAEALGITQNVGTGYSQRVLSCHALGIWPGTGNLILLLRKHSRPG